MQGNDGDVSFDGTNLLHQGSELTSDKVTFVSPCFKPFVQIHVAAVYHLANFDLESSDRLVCEWDETDFIFNAFIRTEHL
jgi:hypothetical protein